jgi:hypothetical protein
MTSTSDQVRTAIEWVDAHFDGLVSDTTITHGRFVTIHPFMFTQAIIIGFVGGFGYEDRWCYSTYDKARSALREWKSRDFMGEPEGWHRHPATGRRRPDGDKSREHIDY